MKLLHMALVPLVASIMTGCALGTKNIELEIPSNLATSSAPVTNTQPVRIKLNTFGDSRTTKNVGEMRNGFNYPTGRITTDTDISEWVSNALRKGLTNSGFEVVDNNNTDYTLDGKILTTYCVGSTRYSASIKMQGALTKGDSTVIVDGFGSASSFNVMNTGSGYKENLEEALGEAVNSMTEQIKQKTAQ